MSDRVETIMHRFLGERIGGRVGRLHSDQSGAVMLLCLAATLILLMVSLIIYDAGEQVRNKIDVQNAADTAAYSTAAVKARTMNMTMYTNVAKRTIIGLHNMYIGMYTAYVLWWLSRCGCCSPWSWSCCWDCAINAPLVISETFGDFMRYIGNVGDYYDKELEALDKYQEYFRLLTPWWAWSEGALRGSRNGASISTSYPPPPSLLFSLLPDWVDTALSFFGYSIGYNQTWVVDTMPLSKDTFLLWGTGWLKMCLPTTGPAAAEFGVNTLIHRKRSQLGAKKWSVVAAGAALAGTLGCGYSVLKFGSGKMAPMVPISPGSSSKELLHKSNIQFAYLNDPDNLNSRSTGNTGKKRGKFNFLTDEYGVEADTPIYEGSGTWSLSRSEFFFNGSDPDPWKARWTAKLRPLQMPGEFEQFPTGFLSGKLDLNGMFHDIAPFMGLAGVLGIIQDTGSFSSAWGDAVFFEKASRSMDNGVDDGFYK